MITDSISVGDLVRNVRWPYYGMCLVVEIQDDKVQVHHREGEMAQTPGFSWDYLSNWVKIDEGTDESR
jgi:hypothetical protein